MPTLQELITPDMIDMWGEREADEAHLEKMLVDERIREGQEFWDIDGLDSWMEEREVDDTSF